MLRSGNCKSNELSGLIKMKTLLWVDDARNPLENDWLNFSPIGRNCFVIWAQTYQEAIQFLEKDWPDAICLDHDLGEEESGYDIAKYIVNRCIDEGKKLPLFASQSANPVGRENILSLFKNFTSTYNLFANDCTTFFNKYCSSVIWSHLGNSFLVNTWRMDTSKFAQNLLYAFPTS